MIYKENEKKRFIFGTSFENRIPRKNINMPFDENDREDYFHFICSRIDGIVTEYILSTRKERKKIRKEFEKYMKYIARNYNQRDDYIILLNLTILNKFENFNSVDKGITTLKPEFVESLKGGTRH